MIKNILIYARNLQSHNILGTTQKSETTQYIYLLIKSPYILSGEYVPNNNSSFQVLHRIIKKLPESRLEMPEILHCLMEL